MGIEAFRTPDERFDGLPGWDFEPRYAEQDGLRLHHVDEGQGDPILLLHGEPTWAYLYRRMIPPLARVGRVVAPDYPGFGRSDKPLDPTVSPVDYMVFDPTYYIEMLHAEGGGAIQLSGAGADCKYVLTPPNPDPNAVGLAASLDKTQSAGNELGQLFAERVTIRCGVKP